MPPGIDPVKFIGLGRAFPGCRFAVDVEGSIGVENGCEIPGVEEERTGGGSLEVVVGGGGCDGGADWVDGTVETDRDVDGGWKVRARRERSVRRHDVQSMASNCEINHDVKWPVTLGWESIRYANCSDPKDGQISTLSSSLGRNSMGTSWQHLIVILLGAHAYPQLYPTIL